MSSVASKKTPSSLRIPNAEAMRRFGARIAKEVATAPRGETAKVVALVGDLGAGKTTFTQGFLRELGVKRRVISPTFLIIRPYKISVAPYVMAYHLDCYRLNKEHELLALGFEELVANPTAILLIEWPELIKMHLPTSTQWIHIEHLKKGNHREVKIR